MENPDLVLQGKGDSQGPTHSQLAECSMNARYECQMPDHSNRVVSPSRDLSDDMQEVAPASGSPLCSDVQQQSTSVCVISSRHPSLGSGCTRSTLAGTGNLCLTTISHSGQTGGKSTGLTMQENHSNCSGVAQYDLVQGFGSCQAKSLNACSAFPTLLTQPFKQISYKNMSNLNLHAWLPEPQ